MKRLKKRQTRSFVPFLVVLAVLGFLTFKVAFGGRQSGSFVMESSVSANLVLPTPIPSPSPTPTPSPIYTGFCLNVPVLMYHHIEPMDNAKKAGHAQLTVDNNTFDSQMNYLVSKGYNSISADQLVNALINKTTLPGKSVVITIDDGYSDMISYAYPILQKYQLKANLMIATGLIQNPDYLSWTQLKQMADSGLITVYDHTWSHNSLPTGSKDKAQYEILTAKEQLEEHLGKTQNIFAYPYGSGNNYVINLLRSLGFIAAFSTIGGTVQCDSFIMTLHRTRIGNFSLSSYGI